MSNSDTKGNGGGSGGKNTYAPAINLNDGTISNLHLTTTDRYGKYSMYYTVGVNNPSWKALHNIIKSLCKASNDGVIPTLKPWKENTEDGLIHIKVGSKKLPPISNQSGKKVDVSVLNEHSAARISVKPMFYNHTEKVFYRNPDGSQGMNEVDQKGITFYLNGIMLGYDEEEDEF